MEHAPTLGTYLAYTVIVLFLLGVLFFFLRTMTMVSLLLLRPARELWDWIRGRGKRLD